jgi:EmrB/QacA subfamily drug resistance transporter
MAAQFQAAATAASPATHSAADPRRWWALLALSLALFMAILDNTIVNVALPHIQSGLKTSISDLQWVVSAYSLVFGSTLITGGKLGDLFGRKRVFISGIVIFVTASALCGLAPNVSYLHAFRAVQGLGGAAIFPLTLAIINATFEGKERAAAIAAWGAISGVAVALGPVIGGVLVDHVSWRAVFYVNVPVGAIVAGLALYAVRDSRDTTRRGGIDWIGTVLSCAGLFAIIYALIRTDAAGWGWGSRNNVAMLAAGAVILLLFGLNELRIARRGGEPMLDLNFFRSLDFSAANAVSFLVTLAMFGAFFYVSLYLQSVLGYSAMGAGLRTLPVAVGVILGALISAQLAGRFGPRWPLAIGMALAAAGVLIWAQRMTPTTGYSHFALALPLFGFGMGIVFPAIGTAVLNSVSKDKAGVAVGVNDMSREVGGTFGIALMAAIFNPTYHTAVTQEAAKASLPSGVANALSHSPAGAQVADMPATLTTSVHHAVQSAFTGAMVDVLHVSVALLLVGAATAFVLMRRPPAEPALEDELEYATAAD